MVHDTTHQRHLRVVGDTPATEDIDLGVTYENPQPAPEPATDTPRAEPLQGRLVAAEETTTDLTPARAGLEAVNARLRASLEASHTYALLAWARWMDATTGYVMDPALRQDMLDDAEKALDDKRVRAAKAAARALEPTKKTAAVREIERLKNRRVSELEVDARVLKARGARLATRFVVPAAVAAGPVVALAMGGPLACFLAWPAAWVWLALQGRAHARADLGAGATATPLEEKARKIAAASTTEPTPGVVVGAQVVGATDTENRLLARLSGWDEHTGGRGLDGVVPGTPTVDALGIRVVLTLSGKMTPELLEKKLPVLRAALSVPRDVHSDLGDGDYGDQMVLRIRTRTPSRDMVWRPGRQGVGVDTETGQPVVLPKGRMLIAGTSGAGKSVLVRVLIADALQADEPTVVVYIDAKGEEAGLWRGKIRCATEEDDILGLLRELNAEAKDRSDIMQDQGVSTWAPTVERPRIVVVVDEGAELVAMHDMSAKEPEARIDMLGPIAPLGRLGRSRAIDVKWATQKPTLGEGIPSQLNGVMQDRIVLKTAGRGENNQVLSKDWTSHELELGGFAVANVPGRGPDQPPIQVWDLSRDSAVASVPGGAVWSYRCREGAPASPATPRLPGILAVALRAVGERPGIKSEDLAEAVAMDLLSLQDRLRDAGVKAGRFTDTDGRQKRGYSVEALKEAADRYEQ